MSFNKCREIIWINNYKFSHYCKNRAKYIIEYHAKGLPWTTRQVCGVHLKSLKADLDRRSAFYKVKDFNY